MSTSPGWAALLPAAMVGTDRHGGALPPLPGAVGALAADAAAKADGPAVALLRVAAVLAPCALAGAQAPLLSGPLPAAAEDDPWPALEPGAVHDAVRWALHEGPPRLPHLVCAALTAARVRLPALLLPQALELGRRSLALRAPLRPVLGERGRWLAAQRDDWSYAAGAAATASDASHWTDGTLEQRRAFFVREREADPAAARERLQQALPELPAKERAELVSALASGLTQADEPLLDLLRNDRSREVRQAALALLLRLPQAAHPRRAAARLAALLRQERVLLRQRWRIEAPTAPSDDWKADQLDPERPQSDALGERGWWLCQLVRQVPLRWWSSHTGLSPSQLLDWAAGTDWNDALRRAWRDVLFAAPDEDWCDALLDHTAGTTAESPAALLGLLSPARRERHLLRRLREAREALATTLAQMLAACPPADSLSAEASRLLVDRLHDTARPLAEDLALRHQLPELACALHPDVLDRLAALPRRSDEPPSGAEALNTLHRVVAARRALLTLTPARTP